MADVSVTLRGRRLTISGVRRDSFLEEGSSYYSMEISYNRFERSLVMPANLENARVTIAAREGLLLVRMITEGNEKMSEQPVVYTLPVLPLKSAVLFPYLLMPLSAGRPASIAAVEAALATESKEILVFTQRDADVDSPTKDDLYAIGTKAVIRKMNRSGEGHLELMVLGMERVTLLKLDSSEPFLKGRAVPLPLPEDKGPEIEALQGALIELAGEALTLAQPNTPQELRGLLASNDDPLRLTFVLRGHVQPGRRESASRCSKRPRAPKLCA